MMANRLARALGHVVSVVKLLVGGLMLFSIALNFANVVGRYVFASPIIWAEEAMIYIMVWCVFLGAVVVTWEGQHLKMDLLTMAARGGWRKALVAVSALVLLTACLYVLFNSAPVVKLMLDNDQRSVVADIPMAIPHAAVLIGFVLMAAAVIARFRRELTEPEPPGAAHREAGEG
jgi:TRAP-type C4-dicarboxylate transport system permease small subunit